MSDSPANSGHVGIITNLNVARCYNCAKISVWVHDKMIYPDIGINIPPNPDMPPDVLQDYQEAASIARRSPRGAAALLRLGLQKLCIFLGKPGKSIDKDIASLVQDGLPQDIQKALDIVRVVGNEAVHPGQMDLDDDSDIVTSLFAIINLIVEKLISEPRKIAELYEKLPDQKRDGITQRDKKL